MIQVSGLQHTNGSRIPQWQKLASYRTEAMSNPSKREERYKKIFVKTFLPASAVLRCLSTEWSQTLRSTKLSLLRSTTPLPTQPTSFIVFLRFWKTLKSGASTCSASQSWRTRRRWRAWRTQSSRSATSSRRSRSLARSSSTFFAHSKTTTCRWTHWTQY